MFYHRAPKVTSKLAMLVLYQHAHFPLLSNLDVCLSRVLHHQASSCNQALILVLMLQFSYQNCCTCSGLWATLHAPKDTSQDPCTHTVNVRNC